MKYSMHNKHLADGMDSFFNCTVVPSFHYNFYFTESHNFNNMWNDIDYAVQSFCPKIAKF